MIAKLVRTWQLTRRHWSLLLQVILLIYGPFYLAYTALVASDVLPEDAADKLFGLFGVVVMPLVNGLVVWLAHRWYEQDYPAAPLGPAAISAAASPDTSPTLAAALRALPSFWSRLLTTYVAISFVLMGCLAITVLPVYGLLALLKLPQPLYLLPFVVAVMIAAVSRYAFVDPMVVVGGLSPYHARQASSALVKGRYLPVIWQGLLVYAVPFSLESLGELLSDSLNSDQPTLALAISTGSGFLAAVLYVLPLLFFYVYYRELTPPATPGLEPELSVATASYHLLTETTS